MKNRYGFVLTLSSPDEVFDSYFPESNTYTIKQYADAIGIKYRVLYTYLKEINYLHRDNMPKKHVVESGVFIKGIYSGVIRKNLVVAQQCKPELTNHGIKHLSKMILRRPTVMKRLIK